MPNIIGDIAGNYDSLIALIKQMPDEEVISTGDMVDRGPRSKQVLEWFIKHGSAVLGNHEHMLYLSRGDPYWASISLRNGVEATLKSFCPNLDRDLLHYGSDTFSAIKYQQDCFFQIPDSVVEWLQRLPLYIEREDLFISHAPKNPILSLEQCCDLTLYLEDSILWNRGSPRRMNGRIQIFGHNASRVVQEFKDKKGIYAYCIDTSRAKVLTGLHWPSGKLYHQPIID